MSTTATSPAQGPRVDFQRPEYVDLLPRWNLIRDCIAGQAVVKGRRELYLPRPNAADKSEANLARYNAYLERAVFFNATAPTLAGLVGAVFSRDPVVTLPPLLAALEDDVDAGGVGLDQQAKHTLELVMAHGRAGLLTDFPRAGTDDSAAPEGVTVAQVQSGAVRPTITVWDPWDIINWRVETVAGKRQLTLVVLSESAVLDDDGFAQTYDGQFRVLRLGTTDGDPAQAGLYVVEIWRKGPAGTVHELAEVVEPVDASGNRLKEIPFTFVGPKNNDATPDLPPLYDLSELNIAHYRNSADYEESVFMVGQPTPYFAGLTESWVRDVLHGEVQLGSRAAIPLPTGGTAGLLQVQANGLVKEAMDKKEAQMLALGAKLIDTRTVRPTATEALIDQASETSLLCSAADNVSEAYTRALGWCVLFGVTGGDPESADYELSDDFAGLSLKPQEVAQLVSTWQANAISFTEMRDVLREGGIATEDDDKVQELADISVDPLAKPVPPVKPAPGVKPS